MEATCKLSSGDLMSMVGLALRLSAVMALKDSTVAGDRIFDSASLPIDKLTSEKGPEPFIAVSTEDENGKPAIRDIHNGDRTIDLVIETAIGQVIPLPGEDGSGLMVSNSDANLELSLAVLSRQVEACLWGSGGGMWGDVFRAFARSVDETMSRRGLPGENGERFAARQIAYRIRAYAEPAFDSRPEPNTPFGRFLAALDAEAASNPGFSSIASIVRRSIEGKPIGWPDLYTRDAATAGMTEDEARKIGIAPLGGLPSQPMTQVTVEPDGLVVIAEDGE
jgi:hypothetical protein